MIDHVYDLVAVLVDGELLFRCAACGVYANELALPSSGECYVQVEKVR